MPEISEDEYEAARTLMHCVQFGADSTDRIIPDGEPLRRVLRREYLDEYVAYDMQGYAQGEGRERFQDLAKDDAYLTQQIDPMFAERGFSPNALALTRAALHHQLMECCRVVDDQSNGAAAQSLLAFNQAIEKDGSRAAIPLLTPLQTHLIAVYHEWMQRGFTRQDLSLLSS